MYDVQKKEDHKVALPSVYAIEALVEQAEKDRQPRFAYLNDIEVIAYFLDNHTQLFKERGRTEGTLKAYKGELTQFIQYMHQYTEEIGLDDIEWQENSLFKSLELRHIRKYQEWLAKASPYVQKQALREKTGYSIATLSRKTTILKQFFKFLHMEEYIKVPLQNGFKAVEVKSQDRPNRDMGTQDVVRVLEAFIKIKNITAFMLVQVFVSTGIRNNELCTLQIQHVKSGLNGDCYLEVTGKGNKNRNVPLRPVVYQSIDYYRVKYGFPKIKDSAADMPLVPTARGNAFTPSQMTNAIKRYLQTIQPFVDFSVDRITPHVFRHAFAIISHENKANIYDIMRSLGHERIETTRIYLEKIYQQEQHTVHTWKNEIDQYI